jgi:hypothetical protein
MNFSLRGALFTPQFVSTPNRSEVRPRLPGTHTSRFVDQRRRVAFIPGETPLGTEMETRTRGQARRNILPNENPPEIDQDENADMEVEVESIEEFPLLKSLGDDVVGKQGHRYFVKDPADPTKAIMLTDEQVKERKAACRAKRLEEAAANAGAPNNNVDPVDDWDVNPRQRVQSDTEVSSVESLLANLRQVDDIVWDDVNLGRAKQAHVDNMNHWKKGKDLQALRAKAQKEKNELYKVQKETEKKMRELEALERKAKDKQNPQTKIRGARKSMAPLDPIPEEDNARYDQDQYGYGHGQPQGYTGFTRDFPHIGMPMSINLVQQTPINLFEAERGDDARLFADQYEKVTANQAPRARVDGFGQFMRGAALDWITVYEKDKRAEQTFDDSGVQASAWSRLNWMTLRRDFEKEFAIKKEKELFRTNQLEGESGMTYFYRMVKIHQQSGLNLDEEQLTTLIVEHMNSSFKERFEFKEYESIEKLRTDIKMADARRKQNLNAKSKEKRKTGIALIEQEAEEYVPKRKQEKTKADPAIFAMQKTLEVLVQNLDTRKNEDRPKFNPKVARQKQQKNHWNNSKGTQQVRLFRCFNCGKLGRHMAKDCTAPRQDRGNGSNDQRPSKFKKRFKNRRFERTDGQQGGQSKQEN